MKFKDGTKLGIDIHKYEKGAWSFGLALSYRKYEKICTECYLWVNLFFVGIAIGRITK